MKSIIITGATSGIGYECAIQMAKIAPHEQIILTCRSLDAGHETVRKIKQITGHENLICMSLDLASLQSIRDFKTAFSTLESNEIVALINNAGIQNIGKMQYTKDGFEITFGVNHIAPLYLSLLLLPFIEKNGSIVFTASGVHDPRQKTPITLPIFQNAKSLAYPKENGDTDKINGERRYSTSKLCNILTVYKLQEMLSETSMRINAFDPGMVPGTGLARTYPSFMQFLWKNIFPILTYLKPNVNTAKNSGRRLANLAYSEKYRSIRGKYFEGEKPINSSDDSYNKSYQTELWNSSLELLNMRQEDMSIVLR
ncbi:SDR family NAD(P)-dependent oxidoreductase [Reichenbachiella agarivorans]|uniref:SDR family NAD(P)-dependent oxidoreductase n=1 Tax=Reichenbachiella agarivorans TaxID=2979464 RepID=A0ABY6CTQ4_9BACT|nr:SDR family NAD(P)-dependent oxidoreductase [Reichenbachiella agarivorans]UXP32843.1 SDR family NAD(P)-dependent oxidoreductase [Reichenbachiella agarivorans]